MRIVAFNGSYHSCFVISCRIKVTPKSWSDFKTWNETMTRSQIDMIFGDFVKFWNSENLPNSWKSWIFLLISMENAIFRWKSSIFGDFSWSPMNHHDSSIFGEIRHFWRWFLDLEDTPFLDAESLWKWILFDDESCIWKQS